MSQDPSPFRPRNFFLAGLALLALAVVYVASSEDAQRAVELRAAEAVGDVATRVVAAKANSGHSADFIIPIEVRKLGEVVYQARGVGNTQVIPTSEGHVVFDTGLATQSAKQRRLLGEAMPEGPVTHVILSHSHQDHAGGTRFWVEEGTEIVAHQEYPEEQRYLKELEDYLWFRNRTLFPVHAREPAQDGPVRLRRGGAHGPRRPARRRLRIRAGRRPLRGAAHARRRGRRQSLPVASRPEDPASRATSSVPTSRSSPTSSPCAARRSASPIEYIASLEQIIALEPEMIVPSHQDPIVGQGAEFSRPT